MMFTIDFLSAWLSLAVFLFIKNQESIQCTEGDLHEYLFWKMLNENAPDCCISNAARVWEALTRKSPIKRP